MEIQQLSFLSLSSNVSNGSVPRREGKKQVVWICLEKVYLPWWKENKIFIEKTTNLGKESLIHQTEASVMSNMSWFWKSDIEDEGLKEG